MAGPEDSTTSGHHHHHHHDTAHDPSTDLRLLHDTDEVDCLMKEKNNNPLAISTSTPPPPPTPTMGDTLAPCDSTTDTLLMSQQQHLRIDLRERKDAPATEPGNAQMSQSHSSSSSSASFSASSPPSSSTGPKTCMMTDTDRDVCQSSSLLLTSPSPGNNASLPVKQDDDEASDVFDVSGHHHPHLFYIEDDDEDDDDDDDDDNDDGIDDVEEEQEDTIIRDDAFENADRNQEEEEEEEDGKGCGSPGHSLQDGPRGGPRSSPRRIPSQLAAVCRRSHGSQVVVRCQIPSPGAGGTVRKSSSCPAAFSPLWTQLVPAEPWDRGTGGRRRSSSVTAGQQAQNATLLPFGQNGPSTGREGTQAADSQQPMASPGQQQEVGHKHDPVTLHDDTDHAGFRGRGRSYSDSDVQRLLIKDLSLELRRIGDEFNRSRRGRTTTFSEPIIEETGAFDM